MRQIQVVRRATKGELQHRHSREARGFAERDDVRREQAKILSDEFCVWH
jgi:hypothetical protein